MKCEICGKEMGITYGEQTICNLCGMQNTQNTTKFELNKTYCTDEYDEDADLEQQTKEENHERFTEAI